MTYMIKFKLTRTWYNTDSSSRIIIVLYSIVFGIEPASFTTYTYIIGLNRRNFVLLSGQCTINNSKNKHATYDVVDVFEKASAH